MKITFKLLSVFFTQSVWSLKGQPAFSVTFCLSFPPAVTVLYLILTGSFQLNVLIRELAVIGSQLFLKMRTIEPLAGATDHPWPCLDFKQRMTVMTFKAVWIFRRLCFYLPASVFPAYIYWKGSPWQNCYKDVICWLKIIPFQYHV